jgi:hypothetical protein
MNMKKYAVTQADRQPLPTRWFSENRYLGYRPEDERKPWAHYMQARSLPVQPHVHEAIAAGPASGEFGPRLSELADYLNKPGYRHLETGWTVNGDGHLVVAILTDMPGVTGAMWDWWFGWHSADSSRYKLWNPDAHQFAVMGEDRNGPEVNDRHRYEGNVSYINEYVGAESRPLAIRFVDRDRYGFTAKPGEAIIVANAGTPMLPLSNGWLVHQVRTTGTGSEMRSRFIFGDIRVLNLPTSAVEGWGGKAMTAAPLRAAAGAVLPRLLKGKTPVSMTLPLLQHCATEMNHLATFLPDLYQEFHDLP